MQQTQRHEGLTRTTHGDTFLSFTIAPATTGLLLSLHCSGGVAAVQGTTCGRGKLVSCLAGRPRSRFGHGIRTQCQVL